MTGLDLSPELAVVVDLTVLDDVNRAILVRDRLIASGEIDDREPPRCDPDLSIDERAAAVRTAMEQCLVHVVQQIRVDRSAVQGNQAAYAAHRALSVGRARRK